MTLAERKLLVTDLDGTLWHGAEQMPSAHQRSLEELRRSGITILAATARRPRYVSEPFERLGLNDVPFACLDGGIGFDGQTRFCDHHFEPRVLVECLETLQNHELRPVLYVLDDESDIVVSSDSSTCAGHLTKIAPHARTGDPYAVARSSPVYTLAIHGRPLDLLRAGFDALQSLGTVRATLWPEPDYGDWALTVAPAGVSKWSAALAFCELHGLDGESVVAVGDGANDVSMLSAASIAIAVKGGHPDALAAADHLIAPPSDEGWATLPYLLQQLGWLRAR